jgi:hypothetical protein
MSPEVTHDERWLRTRVVDMAQVRGILWHYCNDSRHCAGKGLPDLILAGSYVVFAELKVDPFSKVSAEQTTWKHAVLAAGGQYRRWYVYDLHSRKIEFELDRMAA